MTKVAVNFTGVNDVPSGELQIVVEKAEAVESSKGNPMVKLQCAIIGAEEERWVGHKLFPVLLLETDMKRETFKALKAFGLGTSEGEFAFDTDDLLGKSTWVFAKEGERPDGGGKISQIKAWGIQPKVAKVSIS
jgi:hypothetical protein